MSPTGIENDKILTVLERISGINSSKTIMVFKTDIDSIDKLGLIRPVLNDHPCVRHWSVDMEDVDNVLRIEASEKLSSQDLIELMRSSQINCSALT